MGQVLAIALGSAIGGVLRYGVSTGVYAVAGRDFPYGTLAVNVLGSMMMGALFVLLIERLDVSSVWRMAIMVGLLGSFTTFSTFSIESLTLLQSGQWLKATANILLSVGVCLGATWLGLRLMRLL